MDEYGIYTAADRNFFPGVVSQYHALRQHGYVGKLAVIDTGLDQWMAEYLANRGVSLIAMDFAKTLRYTDVLSDETAGMRGWSFKAFGIMKANLFKRFTFIDGDYLPLCNLQEELFDRIDRGEFLCTEDGLNTWDERHADAVGVQPGTYMNINAGFFSASLAQHGPLLEEWRNLMTRRKPFDLWYGDQGALNVILDKYGVPKSLVGDKADWNQTWLNENLAQKGRVVVKNLSPPVLKHKGGRRIYGWHGCGWCRYWHCIGIDHYRSDPAEIEKMRQECSGKVPEAVLKVFTASLFHGGDLRQEGHLLVPQERPARPTVTGRLRGGRQKKTRHAARKVFIDCGVREGDGIAAFLGDREAGGGAFARCLRPRSDASDFEFIGFEAPNYRHLDTTRNRFSKVNFALVEKLVWIHDGTVAFDSDGESSDCRLLQVSRLENGAPPWRHPNPSAVVRDLPCIDLAKWLLENFASHDYVILKLDIEGAEYEVLERLIETDAISRVRELYVEYHWWGTNSLRTRIESYLRNHAGIYYRNDWP